jgi:hypothetical protein
MPAEPVQSPQMMARPGFYCRPLDQPLRDAAIAEDPFRLPGLRAARRASISAFDLIR